jgi:hypothetical protein
VETNSQYWKLETNKQGVDGAVTTGRNNRLLLRGTMKYVFM